MQPILTADSFKQISGLFQVQLVCADFSDAVKTADDLVRCAIIKVLFITTAVQDN